MSAPVPTEVAAWQPRRVHLDGSLVPSLPHTFDLPRNARELTVKCRAVAGPGATVTVTDSVGVTPLFPGDEETWSGEGEPLAGTFSVTIAALADVVTVLWTERVR
jgi:hypothetical protein